MKNAEISGLIKKRYKIRTTDSNHSDPIAPRIFQTEEPATHPTRPNELWASDISYVSTLEGFLYLATYLDVFTRKVVGFSMGESLETSLILEALEMALGRQKAVGVGLISHSDRGCQYASKVYRKRLDSIQIRASMSRKGNCYDNAFAESFFATLKKELIYRKEYKNKEEAKKSIFEFIEVWYNQKRIHSSIGYKTPIQFETSQIA
jgi:transposase InsO family protein